MCFGCSHVSGKGVYTFMTYLDHSHFCIYLIVWVVGKVGVIIYCTSVLKEDWEEVVDGLLCVHTNAQAKKSNLVTLCSLFIIGTEQEEKKKADRSSSTVSWESIKEAFVLCRFRLRLVNLVDGDDKTNKTMSRRIKTMMMMMIDSGWRIKMSKRQGRGENTIHFIVPTINRH